MARKVVVELADDLDGSAATQTVRFGYQGIDYELDLNDANADEMKHWMENYISHARRTGGKRQAAKPTSEFNAGYVRVWALENGFEVSARGRIPANVLEAYKAAGQG